MHALTQEHQVVDALRRWVALETLWRLGTREEAQRLAGSFVGQRAWHLGENLVQLTAAHVETDLNGPGGIAIRFDWEDDQERCGRGTDFRELIHAPEES